MAHVYRKTCVSMKHLIINEISIIINEISCMYIHIYICVYVYSYHQLASGYLTQPWKIAYLQMVYLLKMVISQGYVKQPEGISMKYPQISCSQPFQIPCPNQTCCFSSRSWLGVRFTGFCGEDGCVFFVYILERYGNN